ncbi:MAG: hypothetical protein WC426_14265 [Sulfuriferula sp.]
MSIKITVNAKPFNAALNRLIHDVGKDTPDALKYNVGLALKTIAYETPKAAKTGTDSDGEPVKIWHSGRARASWYVAWKELGLAGMAYATASAVKQFAAKDGTIEFHLNGLFPHLIIKNMNPYIKHIPNFSIESVINSALAKQSSKMMKYVQQQIRKRKSQHLK